MSVRALGRQFTRENLRGDVRLAQHAQEMRAERVAMGYKTETKTFYRGRDMPQTDDSENRLTLASADKEHAARTAQDAEDKANHKPMSNEERDGIHADLARNGW